MTPSQVRVELLRQHADLRQMIESVREVARSTHEGEPLRQELQAGALRLAEALSDHNQREEELLRAVTTDGGCARADTESMNRRHFEEHKALHSALVAVSVDPDVPSVARHLVAALDTVVEHMDHEERTLFDQGLLSDDEPDTEPHGSAVWTLEESTERATPTSRGRSGRS